LPFARALRYYHAAIWAEGAWTVKRPTQEKVATATELLQKLQETYHGASESDYEF
jgi:hypothetical protein